MSQSVEVKPPSKTRRILLAVVAGVVCTGFLAGFVYLVSHGLWKRDTRNDALRDRLETVQLVGELERFTLILYDLREVHGSFPHCIEESEGRVVAQYADAEIDVTEFYSAMRLPPVACSVNRRKSIVYTGTDQSFILIGPRGTAKSSEVNDLLKEFQYPATLASSFRSGKYKDYILLTSFSHVDLPTSSTIKQYYLGR